MALKTTIEQVDEELVDRYIQKVREDLNILYPFTTPRAPLRNGNKVILDSRAYFARGVLTLGVQGGKLELEVRVSWLIKIVFGFIFLFFFMFLISNNVVINEEENPPFIDRLTFVAIVYIAFLIPLFLFHLGRNQLIKKLNRDLNLLRE